MGNLSSTFWSYFLEPPREIRLLLLGLDAAGKTTILYKVKLGSEVVTTIPTIGFNVEKLNVRGTIVTAWDVGGRSKMRPLFRHYYAGTDGVVFVVDSNDMDRMDQARDELHRAMNDIELRGKPLLVMCNKQDLPNAQSPDVISENLELASLRKNQICKAVGCCATTGEGLQQGLGWICDTLNGKEDKNDENLSTVTSDSDSSICSDEICVKLDHDPAALDNPTLQHFELIKRGTECPFAKSAKLWGGAPLPPGTSIEEQAKANVAPLADFVRRSNSGETLDGYCIELDAPAAREGGPNELGKCTRRMLAALSDNDPANENVMKVKYIGSRGWRFRFNKADFFVTTFSPCYPPTSSRFCFGSGRAFLLLQPEDSFARHDIVEDSAVTNWDAPKTIRDKTRVSFRNAGRPYHIPKTTRYPPAEHIVKPIIDIGANKVRWWQREQ